MWRGEEEKRVAAHQGGERRSGCCGRGTEARGAGDQRWAVRGAWVRMSSGSAGRVAAGLLLLLLLLLLRSV